MKTLYIDCSMGCAGDMLTAALLELHPDPAAFLADMNAALGGRAVVSAAPDAKCGIRGTHVTVRIHGQQEGAHRCTQSVRTAAQARPRSWPFWTPCRFRGRSGKMPRRCMRAFWKPRARCTAARSSPGALS